MSIDGNLRIVESGSKYRKRAGNVDFAEFRFVLDPKKDMKISVEQLKD